MTNLSERLKNVRIEKRLTQAELAERLEVTKQAISNVEGGRSNPSIEFISKLITELDVNSNWLIAGIGEPFNTITEKDTTELDAIIEAHLKKHGLI